MALDDTYSKILMHFNSDWTDESGKVWTPQGSVAIDTVNKKFGTGAGYLPGIGSWVQTPGNADYMFGANPYCVDFWIKTTSTVGIIISNFDGGNIYYSASIAIGLDHMTNAHVYWYTYYGNGVTLTCTSKANDDVWHHVEAGRNESNFYLFFDGHLESSAVIADQVINGSGSPLLLGRDGYGADYYTGLIDELRISKGTCRHTSDFTPMTHEYGVSPKPGLFSFVW